MREQRSPRVFISYSHDSEEHAARVLRLANDLRGDGAANVREPVSACGWAEWSAENDEA